MMTCDDAVKSGIPDLTRALMFAAMEHQSARRANGVTPYINHPISVVNTLVAHAVFDTDTLVAAALHHAIEDAGTDPEIIRGMFGARPLEIIQESTTSKLLLEAERRQIQLARAATISDEAKLLRIADLISDIRDLIYVPQKVLQPADVLKYAHWCNECMNGYSSVRNESLKTEFYTTVEILIKSFSQN